MQQQTLVNTLKVAQTQKGSELTQLSIGVNDDVRKGEITLGQNIFENLVLRQDSAISELNKLSKVQEDESGEMAELTKIRIKRQKVLIAKLEKLKKFLLVLKVRKPQIFGRFVKEFMQTKLLYGKTAGELEDRISPK